MKEEKHIEVLKTYKTYVGGNFPRTESGRYYKVFDNENNLIANACLCSRKDLRDAVKAARTAVKGWSSRSAYNRGQILYRIAEVLETQRGTFESDLIKTGFTAAEAKKDVNDAIDRLIYFAGWTDKYQQIFGSVNPVTSSYFNFSLQEPVGVAGIFAPEKSPLLGLVAVIAPVIAGGNTCVVLASEKFPLPAINFAEVLNSSDVPGGVVNILTGTRDELAEHFSSHMDINAVFYTDKLPPEMAKKMDENASLNVKRIIRKTVESWSTDTMKDPYSILDFQETKTTWHPIGY